MACPLVAGIYTRMRLPGFSLILPLTSYGRREIATLSKANCLHRMRLLPLLSNVCAYVSVRLTISLHPKNLYHFGAMQMFSVKLITRCYGSLDNILCHLPFGEGGWTWLWLPLPVPTPPPTRLAYLYLFPPGCIAFYFIIFILRRWGLAVIRGTTSPLNFGNPHLSTLHSANLFAITSWPLG